MRGQHCREFLHLFRNDVNKLPVCEVIQHTTICRGVGTITSCLQRNPTLVFLLLFPKVYDDLRFAQVFSTHKQREDLLKSIEHSRLKDHGVSLVFSGERNKTRTAAKKDLLKSVEHRPTWDLFKLIPAKQTMGLFEITCSVFNRSLYCPTNCPRAQGGLREQYLWLVLFWF